MSTPRKPRAEHRTHAQHDNVSSASRMVRQSGITMYSAFSSRAAQSRVPAAMSPINLSMNAMSRVS